MVFTSHLLYGLMKIQQTVKIQLGDKEAMTLDLRQQLFSETMNLTLHLICGMCLKLQILVLRKKLILQN
ncbi:hypothetical protein X975_19433, partial [Stegodyphus mimosarum]